jgi:pimeloyl-ACP methyl ester carboxylesterase
VVVLLTLALCALLAGTAGAHTRTHHARKAAHARRVAAPRTTGIRRIPVVFSVINHNDSMVTCNGDNTRYAVAGTLVLPAGPAPPGVTLYAHGLGYARYFWDFTQAPAYDFAAALAAAGHASVVIDRLGYGASGIPKGADTCVGSQASILHQIVQDLRDGSYTALRTPPLSFDRVGLVGHSAGGELAEIEAYSYRDVNAVGIMEWADQGYSVGAYGAFGADAVQCVLGTTKQVGTNVGGYATFGQSTATYDSLMFAGIDPAVESEANALRTNDPCGQIETILTGVAIDALNVATIKVPIMFVHAADDAIFQAGLPWWQLQKALYLGTPKLTDVSLAGVGHAVTLEHSAAALDSAAATWLQSNGL